MQSIKNKKRLWLTDFTGSEQLKPMQPSPQGMTKIHIDQKQVLAKIRTKAEQSITALQSKRRTAEEKLFKFQRRYQMANPSERKSLKKGEKVTLMVDRFNFATLSLKTNPA